MRGEVTDPYLVISQDDSQVVGIHLQPGNALPLCGDQKLLLCNFIIIQSILETYITSRYSITHD